MVILLFMTGISNSYAQYPSDNGKFEVNVLQGCAPLTVQITSPCTNCSDYDFNNDANGDGTSFTYNSPGTYTVEAFAAGGISDRVTINVYQDTIPQFNIYKCGGRQVEIRINDNNYDRYQVLWGDGNTTTITPPDKDALHLYGTSGSKTISVKGLYTSGAANCTANQKTVTDIDNLPVASITSIAPVNNQTDKLVIKYSASDDALYRLQLSINSNNNFIPVQDLDPKKDSVIISSLLLNNNYYCFRIATLNACLSGNPPQVYSSIICSQVFNVNFSGNEENILSWTTTSTGASGYSVVRKEEGNTTNINLSDPNRRTYNDDQVICNIEYCYSLITNYPSGATSRSLERCGTAKLTTTPPAVQDMVSAVNTDQINLDWEAPANTVVDFYNLFRSTNSSPFDVAENNLTSTQFTDAGLSPGSNTYCYQVNYKDRCGNVSEMSESICALRLRGGAANLKLIKVSWNVYKGYSGGISHYLVEKYDANGSLIATFTVNGTTLSDSLEINDPQELQYKVIAIPNDATFEESVSNILKIIRQANFTAPNAFVPGSGGDNAVFKIISPFIAQMDLRIFNRWGEMVYHTTDPEIGWPGTNQSGSPLPQGTYIYQALLVSEAGEESEAYGTVLLIRR